ncbi:MAG: NAD(P)/FAD-dependent oxidoreductase [Patescibacteria group bacterium]
MSSRVVIVGAGFGGLRTALALAKHGAYEVVLVEKNSTHVYTPWLYEVASGRTDSVPHGNANTLQHSAGLSLAKILHGSGVQLRHATVARVDATHRHVVFDDGNTLAYDALVVAVGSQVSYFGISGLQEYSLPLKTLDDAARIRNCVAQAMTHAAQRDVNIVIGGGGPSGVELVAELAIMVRAREQRGTLPRNRVHFTLVDAASRVLSMCRPSVSRKAEERLRALGVRVLSNTMVTKLAQNMVSIASKPGSAPSGSPIAGGEPRTLSCHCMVWCGGVAPSALTAVLDMPKDARGRIQIDATGEVVGHANVFALGDVATYADAKAPPLPQTAQTADAVAEHIARNVVAALARKKLASYVQPKSWPFVITVGGRWGVAEIAGFVITGFVGYAIRRAADLRYLSRILPLLAAVRVWRSRMKLYAKND